MDAGVLAAIRRLPRHKRAIEEMVFSSESLRTLCGDLAEAEQTLRRWEGSGAAGDALYVEYRQLIEGLEAELRQAIHERYRLGDRNRV
jgi:hypothetical protein